MKDLPSISRARGHILSDTMRPWDHLKAAMRREPVQLVDSYPDPPRGVTTDDAEAAAAPVDRRAETDDQEGLEHSRGQAKSEGHIPRMQLQGSDLIGSAFNNADLRYADLSGARCSRADFTAANLSFATAEGSFFMNASLRDVFAVRSVFSYASMQSVDCTHAEFSGAMFDHAKLLRAVMTGIRARGTVFAAAGLVGANFSDSVCDRADFRNASVAEADFSGASLLGSDLRQVEWQSAYLGGVVWDDATRWGRASDWVRRKSHPIAKGTYIISPDRARDRLLSRY